MTSDIEIAKNEVKEEVTNDGRGVSAGCRKPDGGKNDTFASG